MAAQAAGARAALARGGGVEWWRSWAPAFACARFHFARCVCKCGGSRALLSRLPEMQGRHESVFLTLAGCQPRMTSLVVVVMERVTLIHLMKVVSVAPAVTCHGFASHVFLTEKMTGARSGVAKCSFSLPAG